MSQVTTGRVFLFGSHSVRGLLRAGSTQRAKMTTHRPPKIRLSGRSLGASATLGMRTAGTSDQGSITESARVLKAMLSVDMKHASRLEHAGNAAVEKHPALSENCPRVASAEIRRRLKYAPCAAHSGAEARMVRSNWPPSGARSSRERRPPRAWAERAGRLRSKNTEPQNRFQVSFTASRNCGLRDY